MDDDIAADKTADNDAIECNAASAGAPFSDVNGDEWFAPALVWAYENGIIQGIDGEFCPDLTIDRQMIAVMIQRASSVLGIIADGDWSISVDYADLEEISDWAIDGIAYCSVHGIMSGDPDGRFSPKRPLTRAEAAAITRRADEQIGRGAAN